MDPRLKSELPLTASCDFQPVLSLLALIQAFHSSRALADTMARKYGHIVMLSPDFTILLSYRLRYRLKLTQPQLLLHFALWLDFQLLRALTKIQTHDKLETDKLTVPYHHFLIICFSPRSKTRLPL
jgi:hypothetical protein